MICNHMHEMHVTRLKSELCLLLQVGGLGHAYVITVLLHVSGQVDHEVVRNHLSTDYRV